MVLKTDKLSINCINPLFRVTIQISKVSLQIESNINCEFANDQYF